MNDDDDNDHNSNTKSRKILRTKSQGSEPQSEAQYEDEEDESDEQDDQLDSRSLSSHTSQFSHPVVGNTAITSATLNKPPYSDVVNHLVADQHRFVVSSISQFIAKHSNIACLIYDHGSYADIVSTVNNC